MFVVVSVQVLATSIGTGIRSQFESLYQYLATSTISTVVANPSMLGLLCSNCRLFLVLGLVGSDRKHAQKKGLLTS